MRLHDISKSSLYSLWLLDKAELACSMTSQALSNLSESALVKSSSANLHKYACAIELKVLLITVTASFSFAWRLGSFSVWRAAA